MKKSISESLKKIKCIALRNLPFRLPRMESIHSNFAIYARGCGVWDEEQRDRVDLHQRFSGERINQNGGVTEGNVILIIIFVRSRSFSGDGWLQAPVWNSINAVGLDFELSNQIW